MTRQILHAVRSDYLIYLKHIKRIKKRRDLPTNKQIIKKILNSQNLLNQFECIINFFFYSFVITEIKTCPPNPCKQGGKCSTLNEKDYTCNCEGTGYKGSHCETGHVVTPIFPKLLTNSKSGRLLLLARPLRRLKVVLTSEKEFAFQP